MKNMSEYKFKMDESDHQIKLGAIMSYAAIVVNIIASLLYTPWMIHTIGQNDYGLYILATSLISVFLIDFGMSAAVARFVSKYNAENNQESVNNLLGIVCKMYIVIDAIVFVVLVGIYFFIDSIYAELTPTELSNFKVVYIIAATFSVISFPFITLNGILTSYEKFVELKICELFNKTITISLIIFALLLNYGLYALVTVNAISGIVTIIIKLIIIKRRTPIKVNIKYSDKVMLKDIFSFSMWSTVYSIAERLIFNITPSILAALSGSISVATFGIASALEGYVYIFASALNGLFLPKISRLVAGENYNDKITSMMIKVGRIQLAILGLIVIGFISMGKDFILLWLGKDYMISYYCAVVLIVPGLIWLTQEIANIAVIALNMVRIKSLIFIVMSIITLIFSLIFSRQWGAFGASLAIGITCLIRSIAMNVVYYKILNIDVFRFFKECHLKMSVPLLLSLTIGIGIGFVIPFVSWGVFLIKSGLVAIIYMIIMWFMCFNIFEKNLILNIFQVMMNKLKAIIHVM